MGPALARTGALAAGKGPENHRSDYRSGCDQAYSLMDFEHVGPFVEPRLILGTPLRLRLGEAEVSQRKHATQSHIHNLRPYSGDRYFRYLGGEPFGGDRNFIVPRSEL